jgi:uncharacterized protein YukE
MSQPIVADQATITRMLNAFNECQTECKNIETQIDTAYGTLRSNWQSDTAAPAFYSSVDQWLGGFHQVRAGLDALNADMAQYQSITHSTESGNTGYAGGWAQ